MSTQGEGEVFRDWTVFDGIQNQGVDNLPVRAQCPKVTDSATLDPPIPAEATARGHKTQSQSSKATRLRQAAFLAGLSHDLMLEMSESQSFRELEPRARAQACAALIRAWKDAVEEVRKVRGEPLPGSRRPAQEQAKRPKARLSSLPPRVAKPVAAVTETVAPTPPPATEPKP